MRLPSCSRTWTVTEMLHILFFFMLQFDVFIPLIIHASFLSRSLLTRSNADPNHVAGCPPLSLRTTICAFMYIDTIFQQFLPSSIRAVLCARFLSFSEEVGDGVFDDFEWETGAENLRRRCAYRTSFGVDRQRLAKGGGGQRLLYPSKNTWLVGLSSLLLHGAIRHVART